MADADELAGQNGRYFVDGRQTAPASVAQDPEVLDRLWRVSSELVGMGPG